MNTTDPNPWVRRSAIGLVAIAAAAATIAVVVLLMDDDHDSATPQASPSSSSAAPSPEESDEPEETTDASPTPVEDEDPEGELEPVPLDLGGATADLDGDGKDDALQVDTFPNTDDVTTSYRLSATLTSTGKEVSSQMTGETPNYTSFSGVVDTDRDGRDEVVVFVTPGGDLGTAHVHGLVGRNLQLLDTQDDTATLQIYESGDEASNIWIVGDRLLSGSTTNSGDEWQMWEWVKDGPSVLPTSLGTRCGDQPATTPPLDAC